MLMLRLATGRSTAAGRFVVGRESVGKRRNHDRAVSITHVNGTSSPQHHHRRRHHNIITDVVTTTSSPTSSPQHHHRRRHHNIITDVVTTTSSPTICHNPRTLLLHDCFCSRLSRIHSVSLLFRRIRQTHFGHPSHNANSSTSPHLSPFLLWRPPPNKTEFQKSPSLPFPPSLQPTPLRPPARLWCGQRCKSSS